MFSSSKGHSVIISKKNSSVFVSPLLLIALFIFCLPSLVAAKTYRLKYSTGYLPFEPPSLQNAHTLDLIEKMSKGRVKIKRYFGGALGSVPEQMDLVSSGAVDMIGCHVDQYPRFFPLASAIVSEQLNDAATTLRNWQYMMFKHPVTSKLFKAEQNRANVVILNGYIQGATSLSSRMENVTSLTDLKGTKVNVIAMQQREPFKKYGWIPVNVSIPELYESLSRGVIDTIWMATAAIVPLKWYEVSKSHLRFWEHQVVNQPIAVNLDVWNKLPADIQQIFWEASAESAMASVEMDKMATQRTYEIFEKSGVKVADVSDKENQWFWEIYFKHTNSEFLRKAEKFGYLKEAKIVQKIYQQYQWGKHHH